MSAVALLGRALDPSAAATADAVSERLLDAALALWDGGGEEPTMEAIASHAGFGRMTAYRRFGDRAGLLDALKVRETGRCVALIDAAAARHAEPAERVAAGFAVAVRLATAHPLLRTARLDDDAFRATVLFIADRLRCDDVPAELLARLCLSFVSMPGTVLPRHDLAALRELALRHVAPILEG